MSCGNHHTSIDLWHSSVFDKFNDCCYPAIIVDCIGANFPADLSVGTTMQFFAYGTYSDGSVTNITSNVTWSSDNSNIAYIDVTGLVTGESAGQADISASQDGINSPAVVLSVIVSAATPTSTTPGLMLVSIAITQPSTLSINLILAGTKTQQFQATGTYSDGSTKVITTLVTWKQFRIQHRRH